MFAKAKCKLCGQSVRLALRHLNQKHPEVLDDKEVIKLKMENIRKNTLYSMVYTNWVNILKRYVYTYSEWMLWVQGNDRK